MFKLYTDKKYLPKDYEVYKFNPENFFKQFVVGDDFLLTEDVATVLRVIEGSTVINKDLVKTREDKLISITDICTGAVTIINHMFLAQYEEFDFSCENIQNFNFAGENVIRELLEADYMQKYDNLPIYFTYCPWHAIESDLILEVNNTVMAKKDVYQYALYGEDSPHFTKKFKMPE